MTTLINPTNDDRASRAAESLETFMATTGSDIGDALSDLLADLMHWADHNGQNFTQEHRRAQGHYEAETEGTKAN